VRLSACARLRAAARTRQKYGLDEARARFAAGDTSDADAAWFGSACPLAVYGEASSGHPIALVTFGAIDPSSAMAGSAERFVRGALAFAELWLCELDRRSERTGSLVRVDLLIDYDGLQWSHLHPTLSARCVARSSIPRGPLGAPLAGCSLRVARCWLAWMTLAAGCCCRAAHPEADGSRRACSTHTFVAEQQLALPMSAVLGRVALCRCPSLFAVVFRLFRPLLPADVLAAITVATTAETPDKLAGFAKPCHVPAALGGTLRTGPPELDAVLRCMGPPAALAAPDIVPRVATSSAASASVAARGSSTYSKQSSAFPTSTSLGWSSDGYVDRMLERWASFPEVASPWTRPRDQRV
jgi:hypothetical protein